MIEYKTLPYTLGNIQLLQSLGKDNWQLCTIYDGKMFLSRIVKEERKVRTVIADDTFEGFWKLYPNKKAKKDALVMWNRIDSKEKTLAVDGLQKYLVYWKKKAIEKQFLPHPATWLNQKRWEDDLSDDLLLSKPVENIQKELEEDKKHKEEKERIDRLIWNLRQDPVKWKQAYEKARSQIPTAQLELGANIVEKLIETRIRMQIGNNLN